MDKAEWDAKDSFERDQVVWDHFPDIAPDSDDWVLSADGGETGFDFFGSEEEATNAIPKYAALMAEEPEREMTVVHWRHCRKFTTDRNACALVLDEIERRGDNVIFRFLNIFRMWCDITVAGDDLRQAAWFGLRADPDTICYCAVKAMEEVGDEQKR